MEDDVFRLALLALGSCVIAAVLAHGIWVSRKNRRKLQEQSGAKRAAAKQQFQPSGWQDEQDDNIGLSSRDDDEISIDFNDESLGSSVSSNEPKPGEFDDLGLGAVRVISTGAAASPRDNDSSSVDDIPSLSEFEPSATVSQPEPKKVSTGKVYASVVSQPKPEYAARYATPGAKAAPSAKDDYQAPEPPPFLLKKDEPETKPTEVDVDALKQAKVQEIRGAEKAASSAPVEKISTPEKFSLAEQARQLMMGKKSDASKKRREPKIAEDQMRIDFDDDFSAQQNSKPAAQTSASTSQTKCAEVAQEVLVLNVKAPENAPIQGAALLPMLLTLGFKFGDQDIFHRHVNSNGKGPVLFSLANMFKPGNFDIDNLENFTTMGLSLFMILPIEGDPHQVFNMMHNAARKIADEFSGQVYDGRRALLTKQSLQQYVEKIRDFERKRMVTR